MWYPTPPKGSLGHHEQLSYDSLTDERLNDLLLVGDDSSKVQVSGRLLSKFSEPFKVLVSGGFNETGKSEVRVSGFSGKTIAHAYYFIVMRDIKSIYSGPPPQDKQMAIQQGYEILQLLKFANQYMIDDLPVSLEPILGRITDEWPEVHYSVFECLHGIDLPAAFLLLMNNAWAHIRSTIQLDLSVEHLTHLSRSAFEAILEDKYLEADEHTLMLRIQSWYNSEERKVPAQELMQHIRLEKIDPENLETLESSGLVNDTRLKNAYKEQVSVLYNERRDRPYSFQEPRAWTRVLRDNAEPKKIKITDAVDPGANGVYIRNGKSKYSKDMEPRFFRTVLQKMKSDVYSEEGQWTILANRAVLARCCRFQIWSRGIKPCAYPSNEMEWERPNNYGLYEKVKGPTIAYQY